jgi:Mycolic acid cyclopropane synthetase
MSQSIAWRSLSEISSYANDGVERWPCLRVGRYRDRGRHRRFVHSRHCLQEKVLLQQRIRFFICFTWTTTTMNAKAIGKHYNRRDDLYLILIEKRLRFYSHSSFKSHTESIQDASEHKPGSIFPTLDLKPGMRLDGVVSRSRYGVARIRLWPRFDRRVTLSSF